jgi:hypothetical protein
MHVRNSGGNRRLWTARARLEDSHETKKKKNEKKNKKRKKEKEVTS